MLLAIDIGNTNIVLSCIDQNDNIIFISRLATDKTKTDDQYAVELKNILELNNIDKKCFGGSIISSVVPSVLSAIKNAVYKVISKVPYVVLEDIKPNLNILVNNSETVGADRIVDCISALFYYKAPIIIIDMGTATTISVINSNNDFIGGCIMAGVKTALNALSSNTAQLPDINLESIHNVIGKNTTECILSGAVNGTASMIDGIIDRIEVELKRNANVIITGGIAKFIIPYLKKEVVYDENLLLKGLNVLYRYN